LGKAKALKEKRELAAELGEFWLRLGYRFGIEIWSAVTRMLYRRLSGRLYLPRHCLTKNMGRRDGSEGEAQYLRFAESQVRFGGSQVNG